MRYVRTANEIIDLNYCRYFEKEKRWWNGADCFSFYKNEIIKQANTIEELCDEFVGIDSEGHYLIHSIDVIKKRKIVPLEKEVIFGAIWTDKGLIYVAKINEKGELELL